MGLYFYVHYGIALLNIGKEIITLHYSASLIDKISERFASVPFMKHQYALFLRELILSNNYKSLCELGTYHGKGSTYLAAILHEQGYGTLTTFDRTKNPSVSPCVSEMLEEFNLQSYVNTITSPEGYIWDLAKIIQERNTKYDFCYFDAGHTFHVTGLGFVLIDLLLLPGGTIVFDDVNFLPKDCIVDPNDVGDYYNLTEQELSTASVQMVCNVLVSRFGYQKLHSPVQNWAVYRKL